MTVIYSNFHDRDTYLLRGIWEGLDSRVIELRLDDRYSEERGRLDDPTIPYDSSRKEIEEINRAIENEEDTLIVCGHGTEDGCLSPHFDYTLSSSNKDMIRAKRFIGIWCNALTFAKKNNVSGLFSSMFITNTVEADYLGMGNVGEERIKESERKFVNTLNSLLRNNIPMDKWKEAFTCIVDATNEVEVFNFTSLGYME